MCSSYQRHWSLVVQVSLTDTAAHHNFFPELLLLDFAIQPCITEIVPSLLFQIMPQNVSHSRFAFSMTLMGNTIEATAGNEVGSCCLIWFYFILPTSCISITYKK